MKFWKKKTHKEKYNSAVLKQAKWEIYIEDYRKKFDRDVNKMKDEIRENEMKNKEYE